MTEAELLGKITAEADRLGLHWHHCADSRLCRGHRGLPDLILLGPGGLLFAELKSADGDTSADQDYWLYRLHQAGIQFTVWRPRNWYNHVIQNRLKRLAGK